MSTPDDGRLHPEGAPGYVTSLLREQYGDALYEERMAAERRVHVLHEKRYQVVTAVWSMIVLLLVALFSFGCVAGVQWLAR